MIPLSRRDFEQTQADLSRPGRVNERALRSIQAAADRLAELEREHNVRHPDAYTEGKRDAFDLAEQVVREALGDVATAVDKLDALDASDPEAAHGAVDAILMACVPAEVREAAKRVEQRAPWWAAG